MFLGESQFVGTAERLAIFSQPVQQNKLQQVTKKSLPRKIFSTKEAVQIFSSQTPKTMDGKINGDWHVIEKRGRKKAASPSPLAPHFDKERDTRTYAEKLKKR